MTILVPVAVAYDMSFLHYVPLFWLSSWGTPIMCNWSPLPFLCILILSLILFNSSVFLFYFGHFSHSILCSLPGLSLVLRLPCASSNSVLYFWDFFFPYFSLSSTNVQFIVSCFTTLFSLKSCVFTLISFFIEVMISFCFFYFSLVHDRIIWAELASVISHFVRCCLGKSFPLYFF